MGKTLVLILGDQLSPEISSVRGLDPSDTVLLMAEVASEASYVKHHKKKLAFIFSAMRHFADEMRAAGWTVDYVRLDDPANTGTIRSELLRAVERHRAKALRVTEPGEWRVLQDIQSEDLKADILEDDRFVCSHSEFRDWAEGRGTLRMEYFYRMMRRKSGLLMDGDRPEGGQWNLDHENRKAARNDLFLPEPQRFAPDEITRDVLTLVAGRFDANFGLLEPFAMPVTRRDAERAAEAFIRHALPNFGDYQDAMLQGHKFLFHSLLSPMLNVGLLRPLDLCRKAEAAYHAGAAPLNAVEGFIRQIIGWREFVRGIYWREGPDYVRRNGLQAHRSLPRLYWTGQTGMACMAATIGQTMEEAYAHHIQRLMVTGNFALLAGIDPHELHEWYLAVYVDAVEWVELPNTLGMSQHGDGGLMASKPYIASGKYIQRMSNYCSGCRYDPAKATGPGACPFTTLYWDFLMRHEARLAANPRMALQVKNLARISADEMRRIRERAQFIREGGLSEAGHA